MIRFPIALAAATAALLCGGCPSSTTADDDTTFVPDEEWGDDDSADDDDDTTGPLNPVVALLLQPGEYVIDTATSYPLLAIATWEDGSDARVVPDTFTVDDPAVASVAADGVVTALAEGETTIGASYEGVAADPVTVTVIPPGTMQVTVVDAVDGAALEGTELIVGSSAAPVATALTDASGVAVLEGALAGPVSVTAKHGGYYRTTVLDATTRRLRLPLRPHGDVGMGRVIGLASWEHPPGALDVQLGLVACATHRNPVMFDFAELMGPERTLEIYGNPLEMPANVVLGGAAEDFDAPAPAGHGAVFALTGNVEIDALTEALESAEDGGEVAAVVAMLADRLDEVEYALETGLQIEADGVIDVGTLSGFAAVGDEVAVIVPSPPLGFSSDDTPVVFPLADLGADGMALVGLGVGEGGVVVHEVPRTGPLTGVEARYVAVVEVDGIGRGNARSAVISDRVAEDGEVLFPEFLDLPLLDTPTVNDLTWTYTDAPGTDAYLAEIEGTSFTWHVWARGGTDTIALEQVEPYMGFGHAEWQMTAHGLRDTSWETLIHDSGPGLDAVEDETARQARNRIRYHIEPEE